MDFFKYLETEVINSPCDGQKLTHDDKTLAQDNLLLRRLETS